MPKQNNRLTSRFTMATGSMLRRKEIIQIELIFRSIELLFPLLSTSQISGLLLTFCTNRLSIALALLFLLFLIATTFIFVFAGIRPVVIGRKRQVCRRGFCVSRQMIRQRFHLSKGFLVACDRSCGCASLLSRSLWRTELSANQVMRPNLVVRVVARFGNTPVPRTNDHEFRRWCLFGRVIIHNSFAVLVASVRQSRAD